MDTDRMYWPGTSTDHIAGSRIARVAHPPHEIRIRLDDPSGAAAELRASPVASAVVDVPVPGAVVTHVSERATGERSEVTLWSGDRVAATASAAFLGWYLHQADGGGLWRLDPDERAAVRRAVDAVVDRDVAVMATMVDPRVGSVESFWMWVNDYQADGSGVRLLRPPLPVEDWEGAVLRSPGSATAFVIVDFFDADDPTRDTDLSLELALRRGPDVGVLVEAGNLHVM